MRNWARACALTCQITPRKALVRLRRRLRLGRRSAPRKARDRSTPGRAITVRAWRLPMVAGAARGKCPGSYFHSFPSDPEGPRGKVLRFHGFTVSPADEREFENVSGFGSRPPKKTKRPPCISGRRRHSRLRRPIKGGRDGQRHVLTRYSVIPLL